LNCYKILVTRDKLFGLKKLEGIKTPGSKRSVVLGRHGRSHGQFVVKG
jgi:hypothetical protein